MKADSTDITIVLDRSGSMESIAQETVSGLTKFVEEQRKVPGDCVLSLALFDDRYERPFTATPIAKVGPLKLEPRGMTALLDAIGDTIEATGKRLEALAEDQRPAKVVMLIVTDGLENMSRRYNQAQIADLIARQRDIYKWDFVFMGANQDAIATAAAMNIDAANAITYAASAAGTAAVYASVSSNLRSARLSSTPMAKNAFTPQQRSRSIRRN